MSRKKPVISKMSWEKQNYRVMRENVSRGHWRKMAKWDRVARYRKRIEDIIHWKTGFSLNFRLPNIGAKTDAQQERLRALRGSYIRKFIKDGIDRTDKLIKELAK